MKLRPSVLLIPVVALTACTVGPNYSRPEVNTPSLFRFGSKKHGPSLGDLDWRSVFKDSALRSLIDEALANNLDTKVAAARVLQAQANLAIARSAFFPTIGAAYNGSRTQASVPALEDEQHSLGVTLLDYEFDFWGKIRRSNESARAQLLATQEAQRMVQVGLISTIASTYFTLREQDLELQIANDTLKSRNDSAALITTRQKGGQSALTDVKQADVLVAEAEAAKHAIERQIAQLENQLSYLAGRTPGAIRRGRSLTETSTIVAAPAGLPSELLSRRPDVRGAEQMLIAANAQIGVTQARLLPSFTFTTSAGLATGQFSDLFEHPARLWQIGPAVSVPVFTGGRLLAAIRGSKAVREEAEAEYRKTVLQALREVSDALIARQKNAALRAAQDRVVTARQEALTLIRDSYNNGATSYLEVLYNDQQLFGAQLTRARARLDEINASVQLYRALGGGWDKSSAPPPIASAK